MTLIVLGVDEKTICAMQVVQNSKHAKVVQKPVRRKVEVVDFSFLDLLKLLFKLELERGLGGEQYLAQTFNPKKAVCHSIKESFLQTQNLTKGLLSVVEVVSLW